MDNKKIRLVSFSPTGTTRRILVSIAGGLTDGVVDAINLTPPDGGKAIRSMGSDELAIIGVPVYGGRVPVEAVKRLRTITASNTLAVIVVVYGNREFEDALLELKNLAVERGFVPIAAGAFIGEHSFSTRELPIAAGRPDLADLKKAKVFGAAIKEKLVSMLSLETMGDLTLPGRFPYESGPRAMSVIPATKEDRCTLCGVCAEVCPTAAIAVDDRVVTMVARCIRCCACIKSCPEDARFWDDPTMLTISRWLNEKCGIRKEPQLFWPG